MLEELHVTDLALIEEAWLEFGPGMTVLTGETGAGKTALVGALKLLLGERADSNSVRAGAEQAVVEGRFRTGSDDIVVRRVVSAEGRSRCMLDGGMATVGMLAERLGGLVDLHGQHDHQALLRPSTHVEHLDRHIGVDAVTALDTYRIARTAYAEASRSMERLEAALADGERRADYLRFVIRDIDEVAPEVGEDESLESRLPVLRNAGRLAEAAVAAHTALRGDGKAADLVAGGHESLRRLEGLDSELDHLGDRLGELVTTLDDLGVDLRAYADTIDHDPTELARVEARMATLSGLMKKYGPRLSDVLELRVSAQAELDGLESGEEGLERAKRDVDVAVQALEDAAAVLRRVRSDAIPGFVEALGCAVEDLEMGGASFEVSMSELPREQWTDEGPDRIEFLYRPSSGQPARPLARIASGGEVSRVMLALKGVLGAADAVPVLVFDEIDAGIGGATAHAVGRRLATLARGRQVLVITHLAQVAVHADVHLVVRKVLEDGCARTEVARVDDESRVEEVARMLSGGGSAVSADHARQLLADAASA